MWLLSHLAALWDFQGIGPKGSKDEEGGGLMQARVWRNWRDE
jgi:hypothetical protein